MALVPGICTQCGATLSADTSKDCMICPYCGTPFIVEKAINHFQNTYNISNSVVNIYGGESRDFVIRAGVLERYNGSDVNVTVPGMVTVIGKGAFKECFGLKEVVIPEGVVSIEDEAFQSCKALTVILLPNSIEEIGYGAFRFCDNLSKVRLPNKLKVLGGEAFHGCKTMKKISLTDSIELVGNFCFQDCSSLETIRTPNNAFRSEHSPSGVFWGCDKMREFNIPNDSWRAILNSSSGYNRQREARIKQGVCSYCGGNFKGWSTRTCKQCGRVKDYV